MRPLAIAAPILLAVLGLAACSDYRDDDYPPPPPGPDVQLFVSDGYCYYWDGYGYCYWDGYGYRPWVYGRPNYYYGPRGTIVVGGPRGYVGVHGVLPPPIGGFPHPILRGEPARPPGHAGRGPAPRGPAPRGHVARPAPGGHRDMR